jgi:hypothetical protein
LLHWSHSDFPVAIAVGSKSDTTRYVEVTAGTYWGNGVNATANTPLAFQDLEPYATWRKAPPETLIKPFNNSKAIQVVVTGGKIQTTWFVTDFRFGRGILIDAWK